MGTDAIVFHETTDDTERCRQAHLEPYAWWNLSLGFELPKDGVRSNSLVVIPRRFDVFESITLGTTLG